MLELLLAAALFQDPEIEVDARFDPAGCIAAQKSGALEDGTVAQVDGSAYTKASQLKKLRRKKKETHTVIVKGGDFSGWDFKKLKLTNVCFVGTNLSNSNWGQVVGSGLGFIDSNLSQANFGGAQLQQSLLRESDLSSLNALGANLSGSVINGGWKGSLANTVFDSANMRGFRFECGSTEADGCPFNRQNLSFNNTDLSGAELDSFSFWDASLDGARMDGATISLPQLSMLDNILLEAPILLAINTGTIDITAEQLVQARNGISYRTAPDDAPWCVAQGEEPACPVVGRDILTLQADIDRLYAGIDKPKRSVKREADAFIKKRNACMLKEPGLRNECLTKLMWDRREKLIAATGGRAVGWLDGSTARVYAASDLVVDPGFARTPLFAAMAPGLFADMKALVVVKSEGLQKISARVRNDQCTLAEADMIYLRALGRMARRSGKRSYRSLFSVSDQALSWSRPEFVGQNPAGLACEDRILVLQRIDVPQAVAEAIWAEAAPDMPEMAQGSAKRP